MTEGLTLTAKKVYEIFSTLLLRDYCISGLSPISLPKLPVMLRDTAREKGNTVHLIR